MQITSKMVAELREQTGAGMMDCKKALEAASGDMNAAIDHLRKSGLKSAAKKASRETAEGRVFAAIDDDARKGHLLGLACETDFLSSSEGFIAFVGELESHVRTQDPDGVEEGERPILKQPWNGAGPSVAESLQTQVGNFGENIRISGLARMVNPAGRVGAYVHHDNKQGAMVSVTTGADAATAAEVLKSLCQHIVVFRPAYAQRGEVPASEVERERAVIAESDDVKKKPAEHRDKIVDGRMSKFYASTVLVDQPWILDDKLTVQKALEASLGKGAQVESFMRIALGG